MEQALEARENHVQTLRALLKDHHSVDDVSEAEAELVYVSPTTPFPRPENK